MVIVPPVYDDIADGDRATLKSLLRDGREAKERIDGATKKKIKQTNP